MRVVQRVERQLSQLTRGLRNAYPHDGNPQPTHAHALRRILDRVHWGPLGDYIWLSRQIPGWTRGQEAVALARASQVLPDGAVVVEIGSFLGCSAVLLAGARKLQGSGKVHCIDPFDASGDSFSTPIYNDIRNSSGDSLRKRFDENIRRAGLSDWVEVHEGYGSAVAAAWMAPIDLLFLDGDQSRDGAREVYDRWWRFLKPGGIIGVHNSRPGVRYAENHDGSRRLVADVIRPPVYSEIHCIGTTTFARRVADDAG